MLLDFFTEFVAEEQKVCKVWVYKDIFTQEKMSLFQHYINQAIQNQTRINVEGRNFNLGGQHVTLAGTHHRHDYIKIWSINNFKEYYYQTNDSIYDWCKDNIRRNLSPGLRNLVEVIEQANAFKDIGTVIPVRFFVNYFKAGVPMELHTDGGRYELNLDLEKNDLWSATYYLQVPKVGGELWFPGLFEHKPEVNSLALFNGNHALHGVKASPEDDVDRVSITVRYARVADLILPGDLDKFLYKPKLEFLI